MRNKVFIIGLISLLIITYGIMIIDTNDLMRYARDVFLGIIPETETKGKAINMYNDLPYFREKVSKIDLTLKRVFVFHNFFNGYIIVFYSVFMYDNDGGIVSGSMNIFSTWKIHKENGKWSVIKIIEKP